MASGFELETPMDRPITYGLFLWVSSLNGLSLWTVIFFQSLLLCFLLLRLLKVCLPARKNIELLFIFTVLFLATLTSASWTISQLIADVFTAIMLFAFLLLLFEKNSIKGQILLYFIFAYACSTHASHIVFNVTLISSILIIRKVNLLGIKKKLRVPTLLICLGLAVGTIASMGSALSKSKHAFFMGALVEHGIAKVYLDDNCAETDYAFCAYKDSLPEKAWVFLWEEDSPFYKMGGWGETKTEFNEIIYNTLTTPKYIGLHIQASFKATLNQLTLFAIGDGNGPFLQGTLLHERVGTYVPGELGCYESSLQSKNKLSFLGWYNQLLLGVIILSIIGFIFLLVRYKRLDKRVLAVMLIILLSILVNAWSCGTLANAIDRLGTKVIWLIPLSVIIGFLNGWSKNRANEYNEANG